MEASEIVLEDMEKKQWKSSSCKDIITISLAVPYTVCIYMYKCNKTFKINKYVMYNEWTLKINIYVCCFGGMSSKENIYFQHVKLLNNLDLN